MRWVSALFLRLIPADTAALRESNEGLKFEVRFGEYPAMQPSNGGFVG